MELWHQLRTVLEGSLPTLLAALGIFVVGWLVATIVAKVIRATLKRTRVDDRLAALFRGDAVDTSVDTGRWIAQAVFYVLMIFVLIAVLQTLQLGVVTEPFSTLLTRIFDFLPRLIGAGVLLVIAWICAALLRRIVTRALDVAKLDEKVSGAPEAKSASLSRSIGEAVYWLVFLLFLPAVLGAMSLEGLLRPVQNMFDDVLGFLPNVLAAVLIGLIGWFVAGIVRRIVTNLLAAAGADRLGERVGLSTTRSQSISNALGLVVYIMILIPVLISALNALDLRVITEPASQMLYVAFDAVPLILGAAVILLIAFGVGRILAGLVTSLLDVAGFDRMLANAGLWKSRADGGRSASSLVGTLVLWAIMVFAVIEASGVLGFDTIEDLASQFVVFAGQMLMGILIFAVGIYLANAAAAALRASGTAHSVLLARGAWLAIVLLSSAIGLRRMGLANDIIDMAFGLMIGAVAVAVAIAFGLGGRDVAAQELRSWVASAKSPRNP